MYIATLFTVLVFGAVRPQVLYLKINFQAEKLTIRLTNGVSYEARTESLFKSSAILPLDSLLEYFNLNFFTNFLIIICQFRLRTCGTPRQQRRDEQDGPAHRNELNFFVLLSRLASTSKHPFLSLPKAWKELNSCEN